MMHKRALCNNTLASTIMVTPSIVLLISHKISNLHYSVFSQVNGKGSLWCVDPEYKPNLIQALKKQPFPSALAFYTPPASPPR